MNAARAYPVTTIGDPELGELATPTSSPACGSSCACAPATPRTMRGLEDLAVLYNPIVWAAQKLIGAGIARVTGKDDDTAHPGALDHLANALGVDPVEVAIELTGYSGVGRHWPAMQVIGGAAALGGAAYLTARVIRGRKTTKRRKGKR